MPGAPEPSRPRTTLVPRWLAALVLAALLAAGALAGWFVFTDRLRGPG